MYNSIHTNKHTGKRKKMHISKIKIITQEDKNDIIILKMKSDLPKTKIKDFRFTWNEGTGKEFAKNNWPGVKIKIHKK